MLKRMNCRFTYVSTRDHSGFHILKTGLVNKTKELHWRVTHTEDSGLQLVQVHKWIVSLFWFLIAMAMIQRFWSLQTSHHMQERQFQWHTPASKKPCKTREANKRYGTWLANSRNELWFLEIWANEKWKAKNLQIKLKQRKYETVTVRDVKSQQRTVIERKQVRAEKWRTYSCSHAKSLSFRKRTLSYRHCSAMREAWGGRERVQNANLWIFWGNQTRAMIVH